MTHLTPLHHAIQTAHAQGLTHPDIARQLGVSLSTVRRRAQELGLSGNGNRNPRTESLKTLLVQDAQAQGHTAHLAAPDADHHLVIDGQAVDVWTARPDPNGKHHFYLVTSKRPVQGQYDYNTYHQRNVTTVMLICCDHQDQPIACYTFPVSQLPRTVTIGGDDGYASYRTFGFAPSGRTRGRPRKPRNQNPSA